MDSKWVILYCKKVENDLLNLKEQIENENGRTLSVFCAIWGLTNTVYKILNMWYS